MSSFFVVKSKKGGKGLNSIFKYTENNGEVIITGLQEGVSDTSIVIPETIDGMPVTEIYGYAFCGSPITDIKMGRNIRKIENNAFHKCEKLSSVTWNHKCDVIPDFCFFECSNLTQFDFSGIKKIGQYAFRDSGLQEVCLPKNIECISAGAFNGCSELHSVEWNCKCDSIPDYCFSECSNLTSFNFADIKKIGIYAFGASGLQEVCLPKNIEILEGGIFSRCNGLRSVTWNCTCDVIPADCFAFCSNLTNFDFSSIKRVEKNAFCRSGLQEAFLPKNIECISDEAFSGCSELHSVTWHCTCDVIPASCFAFCLNLTRFDLSGIKKIGQYSFWGSGLISVTLSKGTAVNQKCFAFCKSLAKVEWLSARNIEGNIFEGCKNIKEIYISDKVKNIEANAFVSSPNAEITFI